MKYCDRVRLPVLLAIGALLCLSAHLSAETAPTNTTALAAKLKALGGDLVKDYGYSSPVQKGEPQEILLEVWQGKITQLLLAPLATGDRLGALAESEEGEITITVATHADLIKFLQAIANEGAPASDAPAEKDAAAKPEEQAADLPAAIPDNPIAEEEEGIKRVRSAMGASVAISAPRSMTNITYSSPTQSATLYYRTVNDELRHYVLASELIGAQRSGNPYVDVYVRGAMLVGGAIVGDLSPRSEMIKTKPWNLLEEVPAVNGGKRVAPKPARPAKASKPLPANALAATLEEPVRAALRPGFEAEAAVDPVGAIAGCLATEDGTRIYALATSQESTNEAVELVVARATVQGDKVVADFARKVPSSRLAIQLSILRRSRPISAAAPAPIAEAEPEPAEEDSSPTIAIPSGFSVASEGEMRSTAIALFDADPDVRALLARVAGMGGVTGKTHAITVGREAQRGNPSIGHIHFLVTRSVTAIDKKSDDLRPGDFLTYGRVYQFFFDGKEPKHFTPEYLKKVMSAENIE